MAELLIRGGLVIDGTGGAARRQDVRLRAGRIAEIAPELRPEGEQVLDASGALVTPGFIENHTHLDAAVFWDTSLSPLPQHGVTSALFGNCSLSLVPLRAEHRAEMVSVFSYIEDIPTDAFQRAVPWGWETYGEYLTVMEGRRFSCNVGQFVGHSPMRLFVMGDEAWRRVATDEEITRLASMLDDCLLAGAVGLSTSFFDSDSDGRPVPSRVADDREREALVDVLARHGRVLQFIANAAGADPMADVEYVAGLCAPRGVMATFNGVLNAQPAKAKEHMDRCGELQAAGARIYPQVSPRPLDIRINWDTSFTMMVMAQTWGQAVKARGEDKRRMLTDPSWRAAARNEWDQMVPHSILRRTESTRLIEVTRPENERWIGRTFKELVEERGGHVSDVLADWVVENDLNPGVVLTGVANADAAQVGELVAHPAGIIGNSDAGAHVQMMCAMGDTTLLLTRHVRDRQDIPIERAVHDLTGRQAHLFGLDDRGTLTEGKLADVTIFDLDELRWEGEELVTDLPGGGRRYTRPEGGYRYTICRGEITQQGGTLTANRPGSFLTPHQTCVS